MHIGFDISQPGTEKAGCGYFAHAMIQSLLSLVPVSVIFILTIICPW
jgi:alpha-1,3-rhamnosyl/mannosyltransferase